MRLARVSTSLCARRRRSRRSGAPLAGRPRPSRCGARPRTSEWLDLYELAGELFFVVAGERAALWRSDGTVTGTRLVADLGRLRANADDTRAHSGLELEGRLYFVGENAVAGAELWSSNGTQVGTRLHDLVPGIVGSEPRELTAVAGELYFSAAGPGFGRRSGCSILRLDARPASATSPTEGSPRFRRS